MRPSPWPLICGLLLVLALALRQEALAVLGFALLAVRQASEWWGRNALRGVSYRRRLGARYLSPGEETTLTLEFANAKLLPLPWLLVRDRYPRQVRLLTDAVSVGLPGQSPSLITIVAPRWYERISRVHRIRAERRGVYRFGPAELSSGDLLGLRESYRQEPDADTLTVFPRVVPVATLGLPAGRPVGEWPARRRVVEDPLRFCTVRDYARGDSPRFIHWKATARTGSLQTKVFDPGDSLAVVVALDVRTVAHAYGADDALLEEAITVAASVIVHALGEGYMVGLCENALGDGGATWLQIRPGRHPQQATRLLAALAAVTPPRGLPFEEMLYLVRPELPFGATIVAVTAVPLEGTYLALAGLQRSAHPVLLVTVGRPPDDVPEVLPNCHVGGEDGACGAAALAIA